MKKLKFISLLCSLMMVISCFSIFPAFADETAWNYKGEGTVGSPYELTNANFASFLANADSNRTASFKLIRISTSITVQMTVRQQIGQMEL